MYNKADKISCAFGNPVVCIYGRYGCGMQDICPGVDQGTSWTVYREELLG